MTRLVLHAYVVEVYLLLLQVSKMGVTSILVGDGVNLKAFRQGLAKFSENFNTVEKNKQRWRTKFTKDADSSEKK